MIEIRQRAGLSQYAFARRIGISRGYLAAMEQGKPPSFNTVMKLLESGQVGDANWLLTGDGPMHPGPAAPAAPESGPGAALEPVPDRRIAEALAVLADEYEALNPRGRESLLMRFWAAYPDLRERERSLARVVDWLGWRVIAGGRRAASE